MSYCNDALVSVSGTAQRKTFLQIGRDGFFKQKVIPFFHRRDSMPDMLAVLCGNDGHIAQARRFQQSFHAFITAFFGKAESLPPIQQKLLRAMIEETAFAVSTNESRPIHTGALFEITDQGLTMVAVDGFRLAIRREPLEKIDGGAFSFVAPGSALGEVKNICSDVEDLAAVTLGKSHILFEVGDTELICRRLEGEFLDYKNAIPRKNPISVIADTKALIESIDRVSVVISEKQKSPVRCLFDHDKVLLSAKTGNGEAKDICRLSGDGGGLEIGFNNRYLMEALRYAPADTVKIELNTGVSPAIIVPTEGEENFLYMVLPVRLKSAE